MEISYMHTFLLIPPLGVITSSYKEIWEASYGEVLNCVRVTGTIYCFVMKDEIVHGILIVSLSCNKLSSDA